MAKLHRLPWQTPIPLPTLRLTPSTVEAPLRIASRISPRLMPSHRQMISGSFVLAMACLWGVKRGFGCASRNAAVFSARYLPSSLAQVSPGVLIPIRLKNPGAGYAMDCYTGLGTYTLRTFTDAIYQTGIRCFIDLSNSIKV